MFSGSRAKGDGLGDLKQISGNYFKLKMQFGSENYYLGISFAEGFEGQIRSHISGMVLVAVDYMEITPKGSWLVYDVLFLSGDLQQMLYCCVILILTLPYILRKCQEEKMSVGKKLGKQDGWGCSQQQSTKKSQFLQESFSRV